MAAAKFSIHRGNESNRIAARIKLSGTVDERNPTCESDQSIRRGLQETRDLHHCQFENRENQTAALPVSSTLPVQAYGGSCPDGGPGEANASSSGADGSMSKSLSEVVRSLCSDVPRKPWER